MYVCIYEYLSIYLYKTYIYIYTHPYVYTYMDKITASMRGWQRKADVCCPGGSASGIPASGASCAKSTACYIF